MSGPVCGVVDKRRFAAEGVSAPGDPGMPAEGTPRKVTFNGPHQPPPPRGAPVPVALPKVTTISTCSSIDNTRQRTSAGRSSVNAGSENAGLL